MALQVSWIATAIGTELVGVEVAVCWGDVATSLDATPMLLIGLALVEREGGTVLAVAKGEDTSPPKDSELVLPPSAGLALLRRDEPAALPRLGAGKGSGKMPGTVAAVVTGTSD